MTLASYGNQLNDTLTDMVSYLSTEIGDDVNIYVAFPSREPKDSDYPMLVINEFGSAGGIEFVGERLTDGEGEWHVLRYQADLLTKKGIFVDGLGEHTLLRKMQIAVEEIFRNMDDALSRVFSSVPAVRVVSGDFIDLTFLEPEGVFRRACELNIVIENVRS